MVNWLYNSIAGRGCVYDGLGLGRCRRAGFRSPYKNDINNYASVNFLPFFLQDSRNEKERGSRRLYLKYQTKYQDHNSTNTLRNPSKRHCMSYNKGHEGISKRVPTQGPFVRSSYEYAT